jgi:hypothetical protein
MMNVCFGQAFLKKAKVNPPWVQESIVLYIDSQNSDSEMGNLLQLP